MLSPIRNTPPGPPTSKSHTSPNYEDLEGGIRSPPVAIQREISLLTTGLPVDHVLLFTTCLGGAACPHEVVTIFCKEDHRKLFPTTMPNSFFVLGHCTYSIQYSLDVAVRAATKITILVHGPLFCQGVVQSKGPIRVQKVLSRPGAYELPSMVL